MGMITIIASVSYHLQTISYRPRNPAIAFLPSTCLTVSSSSRTPQQPPVNVAGDYGTIDMETGDLLVDGNVYDLSTFGLAASRHPQTQAPEDAFEAASEMTVRRELVLEPGLAVLGLAEAPI
ncbi:hypothetical protein K439DRAFT_334859 [Ramaria rubella]|nr:hypothetical protein K439DRAFT_334859 [Ramaria rubella]